MRLLLLLSALLSSLCGVGVAATAAAAPVEASVSVGEQADAVGAARRSRHVAGFVPSPSRAWHAADGPASAAVRPLYADRLRE